MLCLYLWLENRTEFQSSRWHVHSKNGEELLGEYRSRSGDPSGCDLSSANLLCNVFPLTLATPSNMQSVRNLNCSLQAISEGPHSNEAIINWAYSWTAWSSSPCVASCLLVFMDCSPNHCLKQPVNFGCILLALAFFNQINNQSDYTIIQNHFILLQMLYTKYKKKNINAIEISPPDLLRLHQISS